MSFKYDFRQFDSLSKLGCLIAGFALIRTKLHLNYNYEKMFEVSGIQIALKRTCVQQKLLLKCKTFPSVKSVCRRGYQCQQ